MTAKMTEGLWQPIETAPRETDLLLRRAGLPPIVAGLYSNGHEDGWASFDDPSRWVKGTVVGWMSLPSTPPAIEARRTAEGVSVREGSEGDG